MTPVRFLLTRPAEDSAALAERLKAKGHEALIEPMLRPEVMTGPIDVAGCGGIVVTSRHGLEAIARQPAALAKARAVPVYCVGAATAALARELGLPLVVEGPGTAAGLVDHLLAAEQDRGPLIHVSGTDVTVDIAARLVHAGRPARRVVAYRMTAAEQLSDAARRGLEDGSIEGVILMSPRTTRAYVALVRGAGLAAKVAGLRYVCLSEAVARPLAAIGATRVAVAAHPNQGALLALVCG